MVIGTRLPELHNFFVNILAWLRAPVEPCQVRALCTRPAPGASVQTRDDRQCRRRPWTNALLSNFDRCRFRSRPFERGHPWRTHRRSRPTRPRPFLAEPKFVQFLHWVLARHGASAPGFLAEAARQKDGYVYIIDKRSPTLTGNVPQRIQCYTKRSNAGSAQRSGAVARAYTRSR